MPRLRLLPPATVAETPEEAAPILNYLMNRGGAIAIDTETTGLDVMRDRVLFWSMATENQRYCFPVEVLLYFDPLFQRPDITWYLANAKYDMHLLANMGVKLRGEKWDIIVMDAMVDDTRAHGLKEQAHYAYEARWGDFKELFLNPYTVAEAVGLEGKHAYQAFKKKSSGEKLLFVYDEAPELVVNYASCDAFFTYMRAHDLKNELSGIELPTDMVPDMKTLFDYFKHIEVPLTPALWEMERNGFDVDYDYLKKIDEPMREGLKEAQSKIFKAAGTSFNPNSNDELAEILFSDRWFGLKPPKYTSGGKNSSAPKPSTDEKTLKILAARAKNGGPAQRLLHAVLDYRHLKKLHGTYVKSFLVKNKKGEWTGKDGIIFNGRVHCKLNQAGARTSRLSSSKPNMQNIPQRNDPYKIRGAFIAPDGHYLIDYDYPQIEFRIAAVLAGEEKMMEAFRNGWDIHSANASRMYADAEYDAIQRARQKKENKEPLTDFDKLMLMRRDGAKTVGLGALYGEGKKKMAGQLGIEIEEAEEIIEAFFTTNAGIATLIKEMHEYAHANECTHTMLGRMRRLHRINNEWSSGLVAEEERQAFNTLVQGSGAEMMKLAIIRTYNNKDFRSLGGRLVLTVHDELISRCPKDTAKDAAEVQQQMMADPYRWGPIQLTYPVPITPDGSLAERWSEAK